MKIAQKFGVSVAGIQDANGLTDPRSLRVGQELVIPVEQNEEDGPGTPTPEATPLAFSIANLSFTNSPLGGLWCFGEIVNSTGTELEQAGVTVSLLDDKGQVLAQEQTYVGVDLLRDGAKAPFALRFSRAPADLQQLPGVAVEGRTGLRGKLLP